MVAVLKCGNGLFGNDRPAGLIATRPAIGGGNAAGGSAAGVTPLAGSAALSKHAAEHATTTKGKATHKRAQPVRGIMITIIRPFPWCHEEILPM